MRSKEKSILNEETYVGSDWEENWVDQVLQRRYNGGDWLEYIESFQYPNTICRDRGRHLISRLKGATPSELTVLDMGVNDGLYFALLDSLGFQVAGLDINRNNVEQMKKRFPNHTILEGDLNFTLPFDESSFDLVWAGEILEHIPNTDNALREISRVLKDDGRLILTVPFHGRIKCAFISLFAWEKHFDPLFPHYKFFSVKSMSHVLREYGFEIVKTTYIGRFFPVYNVMMFDSRKR